MQDSIPQRPLVGIFWMLVTGMCFVAVTALVKFMGKGVPPAEAAFIRYAVGLVFVLPFIRSIIKENISLKLWGLFATRGLLHSLGVILWFFAMTRIPLAEVTAMNYLSPIYVTIGAALFLGEKLAFRRIIAIGVALVGAVIILRPGFRELGPGHLAMLGNAAIFGVSYIVAKIVSDASKPTTVVTMLSIWVTIGLAPFAAANWVTPTWGQLGLLSAVACFATAGHFTMTLAFRSAPLTVTQPVTFLQLVWATTLGAVFFMEPVDFYVVLGGLVIISAVSFITWREAMLRRRVITPPTPATKV